jgi:hypothetical protein
MADPREFYNRFVMPTVLDWQANQLDIRLATFAICQMDILAEHFLLQLSEDLSRQGVGDRRDILASREPLIGIVRDVHDTHKHGRLTRRNAKITKGQVPEASETGGTFGSTAFGETSFGAGVTELVVELDSGSTMLVVNIIDSAKRFWEAELQRHGL